MLHTPDTAPTGPYEPGTSCPVTDDCANCEQLADAVDDLKERITELADENKDLQPDHRALDHLLDSLREYFEWVDSDRMTSTLSPLLRTKITTTLRDQVARSIGEVR
jgi:hypothetical protein